jgi:aspartyl-tRNA(Asn)/glutamyl-tRNA(Gln) amidotransferase subunit B
VWLGICDGNMQEGSFRIDANVSVRPFGQKEFGTRTEVKNVNSFRFLERAIQYEIRRQIELIEDGGKVIQETRLYDPDRDETRSMRTKEDAHDYRYFPDPDLPPLVISDEWIARVRSEMPELPAAKRARFETEYSLTAYDAAQLTVSRDTASFFEATAKALPDGQAKLAANWVTGELAAALNRDELDVARSPVSSEQLAKLLVRIADGTISNKMAREVFGAIWAGENGGDADAIISARGLKQISDSGAIGAMIDEVLAANPAIVAEYRAGKEKAFNSLVGQIMKAAKGKANPTQVNELLKQKLVG